MRKNSLKCKSNINPSPILLDMPIILRVAVPVPLRKTFDYLLPKNAAFDNLRPGARIVVPFGRRTKIGYLLEIAEQTQIEWGRLKRAHKILDEGSLLSETDLKLLQWASDYYHHPIGEVVSTAFPVLLRNGKAALHRAEKCLRLTEEGRALAPSALHRAPRQAALLEMLQHASQGLSGDQLAAIDWDWRAAARGMFKKGLVEFIEDSRLDKGEAVKESACLKLNSAQQAATQSVLARLGSFAVFLLEGVTGSGKTEVYLHLIQQVLEQGEQVMVLLPEITLTPQLEAHFKARLAAPIAVFHSALGESERRLAWLRFRNNEVPILLGTRSAVFAPMQKPGLIILDEEHDVSFKQQEGFRFSARDIAVVRAQRLGIPVLLGSATPSLESVLNAQRGRYRHLELPERAGCASHPRLRLLDVRNQKLKEGLSAPLIAEIQKVFAAKEQVLLFLNRRGYAPTLICHACGWVAQCPRCDANMVIHYQEKRLCCHHCSREQALLETCLNCHGSDLRPLGLGTERVEKALAELFPEAIVARIDRDSTRRKGSLRTLLKDIHAGKVDILLGTQMLAKGHHFPNVTLVGVLDVDAGLFSIDFRASERMAQLIVQVAGRAGRAAKAGTVMLQTRHPDHPLLRSLIKEGYQSFAHKALAERQLAGLPPFAYQALMRAEAAEKEAPLRFLNRVFHIAQRVPACEVDVLGPAPAPLGRRAGRYRYQLLFQSASRERLHALLDAVMPMLTETNESKKVRWSLDVDPVDLS